MRKYRNPNIKSYTSKDNKDYYYSFDLFLPGRKRFHFYLAEQSSSSNYYRLVSFNTVGEIFGYNSYLRLFENLYLAFYEHGSWAPQGAKHDYFILSPSAKLKIKRY